MRKSCFYLWFSLISLTAIGQSPEIDSLLSVLDNAPMDSARVNTLLQLSSKYYRTVPAEAIRLGKEARNLAEEIDFKKGLAFAYKSIGMGYYFSGNYVDALVNWKQSLATFESIGDQNGVSNMLNNLGAVQFNGGDDEKAIEYYLQSLRVAEKINDTLRIATALVNIGAVYFNKKGTYDLALEYYKRALPLSKKLGDLDAIGTSAVNMGGLCKRRRLFKSHRISNTGI